MNDLVFDNGKKSDQHKTDRLKQQILKELYFDKFLSCADLSLRVKKSLPIVSKLLTELIEEKYVTEVGHGPSSGGRRPVMYSLKPHEKLIVAIAMDQLSTRIVIYDLMHNKLTETKTIELELEENPKALPTLLNLIDSYISESGVPKKNIVGVGISMPGFVDVKKGINYSFVDAGGASLQNYLSEKLDLPVYIDNDSCLIALAELKFGKARNKENVMVINVAWGIGLGMILNGEIFRGHSGFAGEFSHIPTSNEGRLCSCGKRGCLETEASLVVVAKKAIEGIKEGRVSSLQQELDDRTKLPGDLVMEAALKGDQFAIELLSEAGYSIGKGLAVLIHIINPSAIILSGRGAVVGRILLTSIQQALHKYAIPRLAESTELQVSELGSDAALIGSAALVMEYIGKTAAKKEPTI